MKKRININEEEEEEHIIREMNSNRANHYCFECNQSAKWASCNLGIYLCLHCACLHRALGTHISFVRSLELDNWTAKQECMMRVGGNERAHRFFSEKKLLATPLNFRYHSEGAAQYRALLSDEVKRQLPHEQDVVHVPHQYASDLKYYKNSSSISSDDYFGTKSNRSVPQKSLLDIIFFCCPSK